MTLFYKNFIIIILLEFHTFRSDQKRQKDYSSTCKKLILSIPHIKPYIFRITTPLIVNDSPLTLNTPTEIDTLNCKICRSFVSRKKIIYIAK